VFQSESDAIRVQVNYTPSRHEPSEV